MWNSFCQQPQLKDVHSLRLPDQRISAKPPAPTAARMWHAELAPVGFSVALGVRPQLRRERAIDELAPNILFLSISGFTKILVHDFTIGNPPTDNFCSRIHLRERGRERHTAQTHRDHQENEGDSLSSFQPLPQPSFLLLLPSRMLYSAEQFSRKRAHTLWAKSTHFLIVMSGRYWRFLFLCRLASDLST